MDDTKAQYVVSELVSNAEYHVTDGVQSFILYAIGASESTSFSWADWEMLMIDNVEMKKVGMPAQSKI